MQGNLNDPSTLTQVSFKINRLVKAIPLKTKLYNIEPGSYISFMSIQSLRETM